MTLKLVSDRQAAADAVRAEAKRLTNTRAPQLRAAFEEKLARGEILHDPALLPILGARRVDQHLKVLIRAARADFDAREALRETRRERDELHAYLAAELGKARDVFSGAYGPGRDPIQPRGWKIPQASASLAAYARSLVELLSDPELRLPETPLPGVRIRPQGLISEMEPAIFALQRSLAAVEDRRLYVKRTQRAKARAVAGFDLELAAARQLLAALTRLADLEDREDLEDPEPRRNEDV